MTQHGIRTVQQYFVGNMKDAIKHTLIFCRGDGDQPDIMIKSSNTETMSGPGLIRRLMMIAHHYDPVDDVFSGDELHRYVVRESLGPNGKFYYLYHRHDDRNLLMMVSETRAGGTPVVTVEMHSGRIVQTVRLRNIGITVLRGLLTALVLFTHHSDLLSNPCANRWCYIVLRDGNHYVVVDKKVVVLHSALPQALVEVLGIGDNDMDANTLKLVHTPPPHDSYDLYAQQQQHHPSYAPYAYSPPRAHHRHHHHHHSPPPVPPPPQQPFHASYPAQPFGALARGFHQLSLEPTPVAAHYYTPRSAAATASSSSSVSSSPPPPQPGVGAAEGSEKPQTEGEWERFAKRLLRQAQQQPQPQQQQQQQQDGSVGLPGM